MPRTLPAALTTAMDSGVYEPYLRVHVNAEPNSTGETVITPMGFTLRPLSASVTFEYQNIDTDFFQLERGAVVSGTPSTISSIWFVTVGKRYNGKFITLEGEVLSRVATSATPSAGTALKYFDAIDTGLDNGVASVSYEYEIAGNSWKNYNFFAIDKPLVLRLRKQIFTLLQQKYLVFATENGEDNVRFFVATDARDTDYTITDLLFDHNNHSEGRYLIWKDESDVMHNSGSVANPIHNLGYLESTASAPTNAACAAVGSKSSRLAVHLKRLTGDKVAFTLNNGLSLSAMRVQVTEVFDRSSTPSWYQILEPLQWFRATEGGDIPAGIEPATAFIPLYTGTFDGILSANENNLQSALEVIDNHGHRRYLPFGSYGAIMPIAAYAQPYAATIDRTMTMEQWSQAFYVVAPNDINNYWTIGVYKVVGGATVVQTTTWAAGGGAWTLFNTSTFSISTLAASDIAVIVVAQPTGAPGNLYLPMPALEFSE